MKWGCVNFQLSMQMEWVGKLGKWNAKSIHPQSPHSKWGGMTIVKSQVPTSNLDLLLVVTMSRNHLRRLPKRWGEKLESPSKLWQPQWPA